MFRPIAFPALAARPAVSEIGLRGLRIGGPEDVRSGVSAEVGRGGPAGGRVACAIRRCIR